MPLLSHIYHKHRILAIILIIVLIITTYYFYQTFSHALSNPYAPADTTNPPCQSFDSGASGYDANCYVDPAAAGVDIGAPINDGTEGSIPFVSSSSTLVQDNSNLFWDSVNTSLGIGTTTPSAKLEIVGTSGSPSSALKITDLPTEAPSGTNGGIVCVDNGGSLWSDIDGTEDCI